MYAFLWSGPVAGPLYFPYVGAGSGEERGHYGRVVPRLS